MSVDGFRVSKEGFPYSLRCRDTALTPDQSLWVAVSCHASVCSAFDVSSSALSSVSHLFLLSLSLASGPNAFMPVLDLNLPRPGSLVRNFASGVITERVTYNQRLVAH